MKTLSFHNLRVGRGESSVLLELDSESQKTSFKPGVNLIVAPNGYGKTTCLQTLAGIISELSGEIRLDGKLLNPKADVLYISEYLTFPKFIYPSEWIEFMAGRSWNTGLKELINPWVKAFLLEPRIGNFLGRMSQGERRKVTWLGAHASSKPVNLLDEPLDGLDLHGIRAARDMLKVWQEQGRIVCIVAHQVGELLDISQEVFLIRDKKLLSWGQAQELGLLPQVAFQSIGSDEFRAHMIDFYSVR